MKHQRKPGRDSNRWSSTGFGVPRALAVDLAEAARQLHITDELAEELASQVTPYLHRDGSPRWSLRALRRVLAARVVTR